MKTIWETLKTTNAVDRVNEIILKCKSFKIGKTGEKLSDRLGQPDYCDEYLHIEGIYTGRQEQVDDMESYLINKYINYCKCDNKKDGDASNNDTMAEDAEEYQVYVVWK